MSATATTTGGPVAHTVIVGDGDNSFNPDSLVANIGDTINFEFYPANHSVIRGSWEHPCIPYNSIIAPKDQDSQGEIYSGFMPVSVVRDSWRMPWYNFTVQQDSEPIYLYCGADGACNQAGMVMIINPLKNQTVEDYQKLSKKAPYQMVPGQSFPSNEGTGVPTPDSVPTSTSSTSNSAAAASHTFATPTSPPPAAKSSGISTGAIAGIAIGGAATLAIIGILFFLLFSRKNRRREIVAVPHPPDQQNFGGASPVYTNGQQGQAAPQTIIIPMTEQEKSMYLDRLSTQWRNSTVSPVNGGLMDPGTVNSTMTGVSRNPSDRSSAAQVPGRPWQEYGTPQSPAEMPPGGYDYQRDAHGQEWINHPNANSPPGQYQPHANVPPAGQGAPAPGHTETERV